MSAGISLFPGLDKRNLLEASLQSALAAGAERIFLSLHIPEADTALLETDLAYILDTAAARRMDIIADVSPAVKCLLGKKILDFIAAGITTLRPDEGFSAAKIAAWTKLVNVQVNASTADDTFLKMLEEEHTDFSRIDGLHNFYPRPYSGLSPDRVAAQNNLLHRYGIKTGAFVAAGHDKRGPLHEGLPTVEKTRPLSLEKAAFLLRCLGTDDIFIGDSGATVADIALLKKGLAADTGHIRLPVIIHDNNPLTRQLLDRPFRMRQDGAACAIRADKSRFACGDIIIEPLTDTPSPRKIGDITIDNKQFLRYAGELQIVTAHMPPEKRTNIVASVLPDSLWLLDCITGTNTFSFYEHVPSY